MLHVASVKKKTVPELLESIRSAQGNGYCLHVLIDKLSFHLHPPTNK